MRQGPQRDSLLTVAMLLFAAGLVALAVAFGLFASGHRRLPMWLSLSVLLLPLGLTLGMFRTRRLSHRRPEQVDGQGRPDAATTESPAVPGDD